MKPYNPFQADTPEPDVSADTGRLATIALSFLVGSVGQIATMSRNFEDPTPWLQTVGLGLVYAGLCLFGAFHAGRAYASRRMGDAHGARHLDALVALVTCFGIGQFLALLIPTVPGDETFFHLGRYIQPATVYLAAAPTAVALLCAYIISTVPCFLLGYVSRIRTPQATTPE